MCESQSVTRFSHSWRRSKLLAALISSWILLRSMSYCLRSFSSRSDSIGNVCLWLNIFIMIYSFENIFWSFEEVPLIWWYHNIHSPAPIEQWLELIVSATTNLIYITLRHIVPKRKYLIFKNFNYFFLFLCVLAQKMASENFAFQLSSSRSNLAASEEVLWAVNIYTCPGIEFRASN